MDIDRALLAGRPRDEASVNRARSGTRGSRPVVPSAAPRPGGASRLTGQEATIARMVVEGLTEREIAAEVCIGIVALRAHLAHICAKLDVPAPEDLATAVGRGTTLDFAHARADRAPMFTVAVSRAQLTPQERAVHRLLLRGRSERQVAVELSIGVATVRSHIAHIQEKLGAEEPTRD